MRKSQWLLAGVLASGLVAAGCAMHRESASRPKPEPETSKAVSPEFTAAQRVDRGKYLVSIAGCSDCHTPFKMTPNGPEPDMSRFLAGHPQEFKLASGPKPDEVWIWSGTGSNTAFSGPWGISYSINLTPDKISGLGAVWDESRFIKAMRTGRHFGESRPILPPMPWQGLSKATDEDLKSIWAYLQSVPPVHNEVPTVVPPGGPVRQ